MTRLCLCKNTNNETYHLFECHKTLEGCSFSSNKNSNCNHLERDKNTTCSVRCEDEETMRIKIAKLANQGQQICGICVATLYKNQI